MTIQALQIALDAIEREHSDKQITLTLEGGNMVEIAVQTSGEFCFVEFIPKPTINLQNTRFAEVWSGLTKRRSQNVQF